MATIAQHAEVTRRLCHGAHSALRWLLRAPCFATSGAYYSTEHYKSAADAQLSSAVLCPDMHQGAAIKQRALEGNMSAGLVQYGL
jgi:hypothetical protein